MKRAIGVLASTFLLLSAGMVTSARAGLILDVFGSGAVVVCCSGDQGGTIGWAFDVTAAITVDGIGVFDLGADGIGTAVQAGLWSTSASGNLLLTSATVSDASASEASGGGGLTRWLFETIPALTLEPGRYVVGNHAFDGKPSFYFPIVPIGGVTTIPEITFVEARENLINSGFSFPETRVTFPPRLFGPTLRIAQIPEPSTAALCLVALSGLAARRRWRARAPARS